MSRVKNSMRNSAVGAFSNIIMILLNFITRTIFISTLSKEYLGINGLFSNILYVLSFAELGVGHAIIYCMYKPANDHNNEKIKALLNLYKKYYFYIGIIVFLVGISIIPFMNYIILEPPKISENLIFIYILYLLETATSYFFSYKRSIIIVNQQDYICDLIKIIVNIIKSLLQIMVLLLFKNYILYLILFVLSTLFTNILISIVANKKYPFIKETCNHQISKQEIKSIHTNIKSLVIYKLGKVALNGTDNIIISSLIGLVAVGLYSNYLLIISSVTGVAYIILSGTISSIGNVNAKEDVSTKEFIMNCLLLVSGWIYGIIFICLIVLLNPFITIWIGKDYLLHISIVIVSVLYFLIDGLEFSTHTYIYTLGLFKQVRIGPFIAGVINIILSLLLGSKLGLFGIFLATSISKILTTTWLEPYVIYRYDFHKSPIYYYKKYIIMLLCIISNLIITYWIVNCINVGGIIGFSIQAIIAFVLSNIIFLLCFFKTSEFQFVIEKVRKVICKQKS